MNVGVYLWMDACMFVDGCVSVCGWVCECVC